MNDRPAGRRPKAEGRASTAARSLLPAAWCLLLTACCLLIAPGCGYRQDDPSGPRSGYQWQSLYRQDIRTVAVPIFTSRSFTRDVEFDLSRAIISQLEANTPYKVASRDTADTILEGEIVAVRSSTLSRHRRTALPQEQMLTVRVNFVWKDLRSGRILVQRRNFDHTAVYYQPLGEGQFYGSQQAVEKLALAIVQELQTDW
jgi:hypothetical protein